MKEKRKKNSIIPAIFAVILTRIVIQQIGIENIPNSVQLLFLIIAPLVLMLAFALRKSNKILKKNLIVIGVLIWLSAISVVVLEILRIKNYSYYLLFKTPIIILFIGLLIAAIIYGLITNEKKKDI